MLHASDCNKASSTKDLLLLCAQGAESETWRELIVRLDRTCRTIARKYLLANTASIVEPEDLVQEMYLKVWLNRHYFQTMSGVSEEEVLAFLYVLITNAALDCIRALNANKRGFGVTFVSFDDQSFTQFKCETERRLFIEEVYRRADGCMTASKHSIKKLIFVLYYRFGLSPSEIAQLPVIALNTKGVESVLRRLVRDIRKSLKLPEQH